MIFKSYINDVEFSAADAVFFETAIDQLIHTPAIRENLVIDFENLYASSVVDGNLYEIKGELP